MIMNRLTVRLTQKRGLSYPEKIGYNKAVNQDELDHTRHSRGILL